MKRRAALGGLIGLAAGALWPAACRRMPAPTPLPLAESLATELATGLARGDYALPTSWHYELSLALYALIRAHEASGSVELARAVLARLEALVAPDGAISAYRLEDHNLDQVLGGRALLWAWSYSGEERYRLAAERLRAQLDSQPRTPAGGFWHKAIYPQQMWLDGLYMSAPFYATWAERLAPADQRAAGRDDILRQFRLIEHQQRDATTGLLYHGHDAAHAQPWANPLTGCSASFWARAIGWYAMALTDVLAEWAGVEGMMVPAEHTAELARYLRTLAAGLLRVQDGATGLWWQVLDQGGRQGNYLESSASAMFAYALASGARAGHLGPEALAAAQRALDGLVRHRLRRDDHGLLHLDGTCQMAGLGGKAGRDGTYSYYIAEPVAADDPKGLAALLLAAVELGR